jgi:Na+-translocating ferredoxin:NAD+ oxidoreductase RnfD subunit
MYILQLLQFLNLLLLMALGYFTAHIYLSYEVILLVLLFSMLFEHLLIYIKEKKLAYFSFSALSTALGVMLMMVTPHPWIYMIVIAFGLLQKHALRYGGKHIFNPSNFALITALLFFYKDAHIVLGQLGDAPWLAMGVVAVGMVVLWKAERWLIPTAFVLAYTGFQYLGIVRSDPVILFEDITLRFYSVSFIVFILFMLTDPRTTPSKAVYQLLFGAGVAFFATIMDYWYGFRVQHLFIALFLLSALQTIWLERKRDLRFIAALFLFVLSAIIYIQMQAPYYFEMDG